MWIKTFRNATYLYILFHFGRFVARDIGGSDPERMAPSNVVQYIQDVFEKTDVKVDVISDPTVLDQEYPLFAAVDRAARGKYWLVFKLVFYTWQGSTYVCCDCLNHWSERQEVPLFAHFFFFFSLFVLTVSLQIIIDLSHFWA